MATESVTPECRTIVDAIDELDRTLDHAQAMVAQTYGGGGEAFRTCSDVTQDAFLWALSDKITEAKRAVRALDDARESTRQA